MSTTKEHKPFVAASAKLPELTPIAVLMGAVLGIIFGASSLYLALKVGMTVSASIPVAVLSITLFRAFARMFGLRKATILENNIVQTTGSAGESIAFGVAVTMPALLILGFDMEVGRIMLVAVLGGLLGVLMMIPLRNSLIVEGHGELTYPEGTACAEVLISGEKGGATAAMVFSGFFIGLFYKIANVGMKLWNDTPEKAFSFFKGAAVSGEISPELLGVGYIICPRISAVMVAGGVLSSWVLIPAIMLFGGGLTQPLFPATKLISQMEIMEVWKNYVLYIGAGAVAAGGIISLGQSLPTIIKSAAAGLKSLKKAGVKASGATRTERDLSMQWVVFGSLGLIAMIVLSPSLHMNLLGAIMIVAFGFLFVTVSSRLTGTIGSSSNPISGMTVATLLITSLIFLILGWTSPMYRVTALSVAAIVCVAASNGGTTSQDLKTGFLVGATPRAQQLSLLVGAITSALVIGYTLNYLNDAYTIYSKKDLPRITLDTSALSVKEHVGGPEGTRDPKEYFVKHVTAAEAASGTLTGVSPGKYLIDDAGHFAYLVDPGINGALKTRDDGTKVEKFTAPKARLMSLIIDGILSRKLPWSLVLLGVAIALVLELCGIASLPFAVGVYLPLSASTPIFAGGMIRWISDRRSKRKEEDADTSPGVLLASGLIAGGSIAGIGLALLAINEGLAQKLDFSSFPLSGSDLWAMVPFTLMCAYLYKVGASKLKSR
ncbi:MAG: oligopeptide transporter, OPT family [Deltaproteobacteria bacterium]|nr:oligopeptide transporter, OPT family [Deltaproteobacteria bacterium]